MANDAGDAKGLILELADSGFGALLKNPEVRAYCANGLREAGCKPPTNHLILICLDKIVTFGTAFLGEAMLRATGRGSMPCSHEAGYSRR
jgi:hypothetical protein